MSTSVPERALELHDQGRSKRLRSHFGARLVTGEKTAHIRVDWDFYKKKKGRIRELNRGKDNGTDG